MITFIEKCNKLRSILAEMNSDPDETEIVLAFTDDQLYNIISEISITNLEYSTVKEIAEGRADSLRLFGFKIKRTRSRNVKNSIGGSERWPVFFGTEE